MPMDHKTVEKYLLSLPSTKLDYPFGEEAAVYKVYKGRDDKGKMFAIIAEGSNPLRISLKCDPNLAKYLREKYETVMPGYHLSKKHWNTIVLSGQLPWEYVKTLIKHSYGLVLGEKSELPKFD